MALMSKRWENDINEQVAGTQEYVDTLLSKLNSSTASYNTGIGSSLLGTEEEEERTLYPWLGQTTVDLSTNEQSIIDLVNQMVSGQYGNFKSLLSGEADWGQFNQGVALPAQRELEQTTLPEIESYFSGGPFGSGYQTGARRAAQSEASTAVGQNLASLRYTATQDAVKNSLSAMQLFPTLMQVAGTERANDIMNLERTIGVWYQNQGLTSTMFNADLAASQLALSSDLSWAQLEEQIRQFDTEAIMYTQAMNDEEEYNWMSPGLTIAGLAYGAMNPIEGLTAAQSAGLYGMGGQQAGNMGWNFMQ